MSLLIDRKPQYKRVPRVCEFANKEIMVIDQGVAQCSPMVLNAQSTSDSSITFNLVPSSYDAVLSRKFALRIKFRVQIVSADYGQKISEAFSTGLASLQSYPINRVITNSNLSLNNISSFQNQNSRLIRAMQHINSDQQLINGDLSTSPSRADTAVDFSLVANSTMNPMASYQSSTFDNIGRGAFRYENLVSDTNVLFQADFTPTEYLYMPMLINGGEDLKGITKQTSIMLSLQLANLSNILSYNASALGAWTSVSVSIITAELLYTSYTNNVIAPIPQYISYPYKKLTNTYQSPVGTISGNATFSAQSQNIQMVGCPSRICLFIERSESTRTYIHADAFANISQVSWTFANRTGILSSASEQQLYHISKDNGIDLSWPQWHTYLGSILVLDVAKDFGFDSPDTAPAISNFTGNLAVSLTGKNLSANSVDFTMNVVLVYDSVLQLSDQNAQVQDVLITREDVLMAPQLPSIPQVDAKGMVGYGFFDAAKKFLQDSKLISKGLKAVGSIPNPYAQAVGSVGGPIAESLGYGKKKGRGLVGGRLY